jgi:hypothetical protein
MTTRNEHLNSITMWSVWGIGRLSTRTPRLCGSWCRTWQDIAPRPTSLCSSWCTCSTFRGVRPHWSIYVQTVSWTQHFQFIGSLDRVFWVTLTANSDNFCTQHEPAGVRNPYGASSDLLRSDTESLGEWSRTFRRMVLTLPSRVKQFKKNLGLFDRSPNDAAPYSTKPMAATPLWHQSFFDQQMHTLLT